MMKNSIQTTKGKILFTINNLTLKSIGNKLYQSNDSGISWSFITNTGRRNFKNRLVYSCHLLSRLLRKGIHHGNIFAEGQYGVIVDKLAGVVNVKSLSQLTIKGSRPLSFERIGNEIVFGEYRSNPERSKIGLFALNNYGEIIERLTFDGIRHIHGVYQDPHTHKIWISTGDEDNEAALYSCKKNYTNLEKILYGSQQTRAIKLLFTETHVYFGSDAPHEVNYLYRLNKETNTVEQLTKVGGSVFHGCKVGNWFFFSTAVEPSKVNKTKYAELWASPNGTKWKCILKLKKDLFPMKHFQYGQIFFPAGLTDGEHLWISPFATKYSNKSFRLSISEIEKQYNKIQ